MAEHNPLGSAIQPFLNPLHCPLIQPALPKFAYEYFAEIKANILLIYQAVVPGYWIGQTIFPLAESMLATPVNLLFLHMLNDNQNGQLFHSFTRDWGEADCPVVSWVLLSVLLKTEVTLAFLQFSGTFAVLHDL